MEEDLVRKRAGKFFLERKFCKISKLREAITMDALLTDQGQPGKGVKISTFRGEREPKVAPSTRGGMMR